MFIRLHFDEDRRGYLVLAAAAGLPGLSLVLCAWGFADAPSMAPERIVFTALLGTALLLGALGLGWMGLQRRRGTLVLTPEGQRRVLEDGSESFVRWARRGSPEPWEPDLAAHGFRRAGTADEEVLTGRRYVWIRNLLSARGFAPDVGTPDEIEAAIRAMSRWPERSGLEDWPFAVCLAKGAPPRVLSKPDPEAARGLCVLAGRGWARAPEDVRIEALDLDALPEA